MKTTIWILVASRSGARIFSTTGDHEPLLIYDFPHSEGRLKAGEINSDRSGRADDARGGRHHTYQQAQDPTQHLAEVFAKELAEKIEMGRMQQQFSELILIASPQMLGLLRAALSASSAAMITHSLDKDLGMIEAKDLYSYLARHVA